MYASTTDYPSIYGETYRRDNRTSFSKQLLPPLVAAFCRTAGIRKLLGVSGGQDWLIGSLKEFGIEGFATDFAPLPGTGVMSFDLASYAEEAVERILRTVASGGANYVTTCFGVLEHIDREHVAAAIRNLYELTDKLLVVSISGRPSSLDNLFHATLMPMPTWAKAFEIAGFAVQQTQAFAPGTRRRTFPESTELRLINRWITADIYGDVQYGEPRYLVLEKKAAGEPWGSKSGRIEHLVDVAYRRKKREHFQVPKDRRININLHHIQEWSLVRPILDVLPRARTRFLVRPDWIGEDCLRAIRGLLKRNGVEQLEFSAIDELPWQDLRDEIVISGAESTAGGSHGLSYEVVAMAKLHGCRTFLLQHGVWPPPAHPRIVTFASDHVLSWGKDEQARLNKGTHEIFAATVPWGVVPDDQVKAIGSAKFTDHLLGPTPELDVKLGFDAGAFRKTVLVGTKSLARQFGTENINEEFLGTLKQLFSANPDVLFIIRPHPMESADAYALLKHTNVRIFDELTSILADLPLSRIVPKVDYVVTSPSTMILDGAITGRPVFVYDTGLPVHFDDASVAPLGSFQRILSGTGGAEHLKEDANRYRRRYAEAVDDTFYRQLSTLLASDLPRPAVDRATAATASLAVELAQFTRYVGSLQTHVSALAKARARAEEELPPLRAKLDRAGVELDRARIEIRQLRACLNEQVAENARLTAS
ncbi:MAG TPA: hypothetical protein VFO04_03915, partial [Nitrospira sp.]|nr:hypothetical protein [Nitrospira sp.]